MVPSPKKATNPAMSVTVVKMTDPERAGSILNVSNNTGMTTPENAAMMILMIMANP